MLLLAALGDRDSSVTQTIDRTNGVPVGVAGPKGRILERLKGFPDVVTSIEDMFDSGDKLVTRLVWRGTHTGPYGGVAATGKLVEVRDTANCPHWCAPFHPIGTLIAGHAVQGAFSALIASSKLAVIVAKKPKTERGAAIAWWTAWPRNATSSGGYLVNVMSWRLTQALPTRWAREPDIYSSPRRYARYVT